MSGYSDRDLAGLNGNDVPTKHDGLIDDLQATKILSGASSKQDDSNILTNTLNPITIVSNGGFVLWADGMSSPPSNWEEEGSPATVEDATVDQGYGDYAVKITTDGANEGIKQTLTGLKPSTKYQVTVRAKVTSGDVAKLLTTGADTNISETTSSTSWTTLSGEFETDSDGTDVVLKLIGVNTGDIVWFCGVHCNEGEAVYSFKDELSTQITKSFGNRVSKSGGTVYEALTDGFVTAWSSTGVENDSMSGYSDSNNPPTTRVAFHEVRGAYSAGYGNCFIFFPVKKGDFWKVIVTGTGITVSKVYWMPLELR